MPYCANINFNFSALLEDTSVFLSLSISHLPYCHTTNIGRKFSPAKIIILKQLTELTNVMYMYTHTMHRLEEIVL